jgi:hypothetical protein
MRLQNAHEQDEMARAAEQLTAMQNKFNLGVPGFQPPRPVPPPPTAPMRSTQYFDISGEPATPPPPPLPRGMPEMVQQATAQAAASRAAAVDDVNQQIATAVDNATREGRGLEQVASQVAVSRPTSHTLRVLTDALETESRARSQLSWQVQGLQAALEYMRNLHQAGPHVGGRGLSADEVEAMLRSLSQDSVRQIVAFLKEAANSRRDADERVSAEVRAQMRVVLGSITRNMKMLENRANTPDLRQFAQQMVFESHGIDYESLMRKHLARVNTKALDQYPDVGMPRIEEVVEAPSGSGSKVIKKALKDSKKKAPKAIKDSEMTDAPPPDVPMPPPPRASRATKTVVVPHDKRPLALEGPPAKKRDTRAIPPLLPSKQPGKKAVPAIMDRPAPRPTAPLAIADKRPQLAIEPAPKKRQRKPPVLPQSVLDRLSITPVGQQLLERMGPPSVPVSIPYADRMIRAAFDIKQRARAKPYAAPKRRPVGPAVAVD